jgi:hypothetical protein
MTKDEKQAKLRELCVRPGIMTGSQLTECCEDNGQRLLLDANNRPVVPLRKTPARGRKRSI